MTSQQEFDLARAEIMLALEMSDQGLSAFHIAAFRRAYLAGQKARRMDWERVSPYYEDQIRTPYFYAGYDGLAWVLPEMTPKKPEAVNA